MTDVKAGYLIFDIETIPDGQLIAETKYPGMNLSAHDAVIRAQDDARASSSSGSDFLPLTYHLPVAICVLRVGVDFRLQSLTCLDAPLYRPQEIVAAFWKGAQHYKAKLVSFNGRTFDIPVLELAAFRYGISIPWHFKGDEGIKSNKDRGPRNRYSDLHLDLFEFFSNYNAHRMAGGLNLLSKLIGIPGKFEMSGANVYSMILTGNYAAVNEYCSFDVIDTYFVFLRTRVLTGELTSFQEEHLRKEAQHWLQSESEKQPHLKRYLENWVTPESSLPV
jgi:predicted PolB exonuclease-like 3'-5' exonuclease